LICCRNNEQTIGDGTFGSSIIGWPVPEHKSVVVKPGCIPDKERTGTSAIQVDGIICAQGSHNLRHIVVVHPIGIMKAAAVNDKHIYFCPVLIYTNTCARFQLLICLWW